MQPIAANVTVARVLTLALPVMASGVLQSVFRPIDQFFVQSLGAAAQGALGATTLVSVLGFAAMQVVSAGVAAHVGRATGAGDLERRRRVVEQSLALCGVLALALAAASLVGAPLLVRGLGLRGEGAAFAVTYLRVLYGAGLALSFAPTVDAVFHAMGDTRLPFFLQLGTVGVNIALTALLVPRIGIAGAALGTVAAQSVGTALGLWVLRRRLRLSLLGARPGPIAAAIVRVGLPIGAASAMFAGVYWLMMATTFAALGQHVYAGLGLGFGVLESVAWPLYSGLAVAASSLVGRCLGAGRPDLARRAVRLCMGPAVAVGAAMALVYALGGPHIMAAFATDPDAYREGLRYAMILAIVQPLVAVEAVSEGTLAGAGDTRRLFFVNVPLNLLRVPLAWLLAVSAGFGADGLWWAINLSTLLKASAKLWLALRGRWHEIEL